MLTSDQVRERVLYLSPSAITMWRAGQSKWFRHYVMRLREPQTLAMALGSAFDCRVKSWLYSRLGLGDVLDALLEDSVTCVERVTALADSCRVFDAYMASGGLADLFRDMAAGSGVRMEFSLHGSVGGVPLFGKPDLYYLDHSGVDCIHDWKVNGYYTSASPKPGFVGYCPRGGLADSFVLGINIDRSLEEISPDWATQIATYEWMAGLAPGSKIVGSIHQITGPSCRVSRYKAVVGTPFQESLVASYKECWAFIQALTDEECLFLETCV